MNACMCVDNMYVDYTTKNHTTSSRFSKNVSGWNSINDLKIIRVQYHGLRGLYYVDYDQFQNILYI